MASDIIIARVYVLGVGERSIRHGLSSNGNSRGVEAKTRG